MKNLKKNLCYEPQKMLKTCKIKIQDEKYVSSKKNHFKNIFNFFPIGGTLYGIRTKEKSF